MNLSRIGQKATLPVSLLCALASCSSQAHASTRETATLTYSSTASCPDEASFRRKVARHLGYDPFEAEAKRFISVSFAPKGKSIEASARMQRPGKPDSLRTLSDAPDHCDALADAVASGIATAIDPIQTAALRNAGMLQTPPPPAPAAEPAAVVQTAPTSATQRNDATATTRLHLTTDWGSGELLQHLGTSYGTGFVAGRPAAITTMQMQRICRLPCDVEVATEGSYYVDAAGMQAREFSIPHGTTTMDLKATGGAQLPLTLSMYTAYLGGVIAVSGGIVWAVSAGQTTTYTTWDAAGNARDEVRPRDVSSMRALTLVGSGLLVAGVAGLLFLPRTHVEASDGTRLDARVQPVRSGIGVSPQGFTF